MKSRALTGLILTTCLASASASEPVIRSEKADFVTETIAEGLQNPWGMVFLPDGRMLVTERSGTLRIIENDRLLPEPVRNTPAVRAAGQGGLLDIELHPDYEKNGWIYLAFSHPRENSSMTKIVRGRLEGNEWVDEQTIFEAPAEEYTGAGAHFGVRMEFDKQGRLFFSIGDRGDRPTPQNNAQQLANSKGKSHRVNDDGSIPEDNPFAGRPGHSPSVWTYGNRNIQGMRFHPVTGDLWATEHGPRGGDELNILTKGENYGWPVVSYGINYNGSSFTDKTEAPGITPPVIHWTPSIGVAGIDFYTGNAFPGWKGNLFPATALAHQKLVRVEISPENKVTHQEILLEKTGRMRDVRTGPDGFLYIVYDAPGRVVRIKPAST